VLPPQVRIIGCQPAETEEFSLELTPTVAGVVPEAVRTISALLEELSADPPLRAHHEH
jgi:Ni,Fe-hydrogenase maturation factor